jgi:hypothetical protein
MAPRKTAKTEGRKPVRRTRTAAAPKPQKGIFRAGTWVAVLVLAVLLGAVYYLNTQEKDPQEDSDFSFELVEDAFLFEDDDLLITGIAISPADGETIRLERDGESVWVFTQPERAEADPALVEAAASQIFSVIIVSEIESVDPSAFGLDSPSHLIEIRFDDGSTSKIEIGDVTPTNSGYYARVDGTRILILDINGIAPLLNLVDFPPYLVTPTPPSN